MKNQQQIINKIIELAKADSSIAVVWLYGSRAKRTASETSDFDLAIAFNHDLLSSKADDFYSQDLACDWSSKLNVDISIIDINKVPTPLAYNVINEGIVIQSNNDYRRLSEERRVWSLWEEYKYEYQRINS